MAHMTDKGQTSMSWQKGDVIGSYVIEQKVGRGGMATVYRARHQHLHREVALKVMHSALVIDTQFVDRFVREARIIGGLDHSHIVPLYDYAEHDGHPYLVMRYIEGQTLKQRYLKHGALSLDQIIAILDDLARALDYAHEKGVLHRDVKPSNIIIDSEGKTSMTDFGLARLLQTGETTMSAGMILGTPNYISPEQGSDDGEVTTRSDIYALGVVLYEMVVGRLPFESKTPYATIHKHIYEPPPLPSELNPEVPAQVEMVLLKALEKDPDDRYQTAGTLADAFRDAVKQSGLTALNPDRSSAMLTRELPSIARTEAASASAVSKPKRSTPPDNSLLLLMEGEESWANLPREEIAQRRLQKRRGMLFGFVGHLLPYIGVNTAIILSDIAENDVSAGTFITLFAWGAGLAAHAISTYFFSAPQVNRLYSGFYADMAEEYGNDWRTLLPQPTVQQAWRRAQQRYYERMGFRIHAAVFTFINLMLWVIWSDDLFEGGQLDFPWPVFVFVPWLLGLVAHGLFGSGQQRTSNKNDASIQAELAMMQGDATPSTPGKRKNQVVEVARPHGNGVRLTEDGELTDSMVTEFEAETGADGKLDDDPRRARR